jgi:EmrB/QacA subfamily drug resistance transporter
MLDRKWWILLAVGTGTFMSGLGGSAVNTVLPVIRASFGTDVAAIEWVVTTYLLVVSGLLLSFGRLGDLRGHKPVYVAGFAVFVLGSVLCGIASSAGGLVAFRGVQALGAAMLFANSPAILTKNFPGQQRGQALGLLAAMTYLGLTAGPPLGGWLTVRLGWRAVFYVNVPVGVLALGLSLRFIPADEPAARVEPFDLRGAVGFTVALIALLLALNQGHAWGWGSPATVGLLVVSGLLAVAFVRHELRIPSPMLDLRLFRSRPFSAATASALINYVCVYTISFLLPFYLIQGRGLSPDRAGLVLTAQPIVMAVAAPLSGTVSDRIGARLPGTLGMAILATGLFLLSRLGPEAPLREVALALAVAGLGTGTFISPNNSMLMGSAPPHRQGIAAGILATARSVGMVLGVGLAGAVFTTVLARSQAAGSGAALFDAVGAGFLVATVVATVGVVTSAVRGEPGRAP